MKRQFWTQQEETILIQMVNAGYRVEDIGIVLKARTRFAIQLKASAMGLSLAGKEPEIDVEAFQQLMGCKNGSVRVSNSKIR